MGISEIIGLVYLVILAAVVIVFAGLLGNDSARQTEKTIRDYYRRRSLSDD